MHKKKILVVIVLLMTLSLTGCTQYVKDDKKKIVKEPTTGQNLVKNLLCQPENPDVIKTYEKNKTKIEKLPKCSEFQINSGGYDGIWSSFFVKPLSWLIIHLGILVKNYGLSIIIVTLIIRLLIFPISKKSAMQSENMKKASKDLEKIKEKYRNSKSQEDQMKQTQETFAAYKKHGINPMSGCLFAFIQMPLFLAFLESLYRVPAVFEGKFLMFKLGVSPFNAVFGQSFDFGKIIEAFGAGTWVYLLLPILVGGATFYSFKMNSGLGGTNPDQEKQMKTMINVMIIFITFISFTMSTSIVIYWITGSLFTIGQSMWLRRNKKNARDNKKRSKN
jgi:YidC/Oxa1 family membrane protein insertase